MIFLKKLPFIDIFDSMQELVALDNLANPIEENNNQFPLILDKVTLGPIAKEAEINVEQLSFLIQSKNIKTAGSSNLVFKSSISHYRGY